jgi:hypothetical protein
MRKNITAAAVAMVIASGVSFAAFGDSPEKQEGSQSHMMGGGMDMNMGMMGEMKKMMGECREMMDSMKESQANSSAKTGAPEA